MELKVQHFHVIGMTKSWAMKKSYPKTTNSLQTRHLIRPQVTTPQPKVAKSLLTRHLRSFFEKQKMHIKPFTRNCRNIPQVTRIRLYGIKRVRYSYQLRSICHQKMLSLSGFKCMMTIGLNKINFKFTSLVINFF